MLISHGQRSPLYPPDSCKPWQAIQAPRSVYSHSSAAKPWWNAFHSCNTIEPRVLSDGVQGTGTCLAAVRSPGVKGNGYYRGCISCDAYASCGLFRPRVESLKYPFGGVLVRGGSPFLGVYGMPSPACSYMILKSNQVLEGGQA